MQKQKQIITGKYLPICQKKGSWVSASDRGRQDAATFV